MRGLAVDSNTLAFIGVAALLTVTPGADMAIVTRTALSRGRRAAFLTTLGINVGVLAWSMASAIGLAALLTASATAFTVLKLGGAAYLVLLGLQSIAGTCRRPSLASAEVQPSAPQPLRSAWTPFRQGLLTNLLNPKVGIFYTTFLPQFIGPNDSVLAKSVSLACIHNAMGLLWLIGYAYLVTKAGDVLRRPAMRKALDRLTGAVLVGFGVRLAVAER